MSLKSFCGQMYLQALPKTWILWQDSWCKRLTRWGRRMAGLAFLSFIPPHTFIAVLVNCRPTVLSVKRRSRNDVDRLNSGEWRYQLKTLLMWLWQVRTMTMMTRITMMTTMTMTKKWKWVMECGDVFSGRALASMLLFYISLISGLWYDIAQA